MTELFSILVFGALVGWVTGVLVQGRGFGLLRNTILGILGAGLGNLLFRIIGFQAYGLLAWSVMSVIGAGVVLWLVHSMRQWQSTS